MISQRYIVGVEERHLARKFGYASQRYTPAVPRWIPRLGAEMRHGQLPE
jgi:protein-S-isoprenylcysteine O-methyltransferase Ste14